VNRRHVRKLPYYAGSGLALARALHPTSLPRLLRSRPRELVLRSGLRLEVQELRDLLVLKETVLDDTYGLALLPADTQLIVDVGAGIGDFAVLAASRFPRASVLACEPNPEAFAALDRNVRSNRLTNVVARCVAVGTAPAYELARPRGRSAEGSAHLQEGARFRANGARLDGLIGGREAQLVKIDCEGGELDVLDSLGDAISRVRRLAVEYHDHLATAAGDRVEDLLRTQGFLVTRKPDPYDARIGYIHATATAPDRGDPRDVESHPQ
jgi:FkbM family methyltransferase